jgi:hypothetical protein
MKVRLFHWVLVLLLSIGIPVDLVALQSHVQFAGGEDFSSDRQDETFKPSTSRKRSIRRQKTQPRYQPILFVVAYPPDALHSNRHSLPSAPASPPNRQRHRLHEVFRI